MRTLRVMKGFTLIELMVVIAIIAILAVIAVPIYLSYAQRARFSEVVNATGPYKIGVETCYQKGSSLALCTGTGTGASAGTIPTGIGSGTTGANSSLDTVAVGANGVITATSTATFGSDGATAYTYILVPSTTGSGQLSWDDTTGSCKAQGLCS